MNKRDKNGKKQGYWVHIMDRFNWKVNYLNDDPIVTVCTDKYFETSGYYINGDFGYIDVHYEEF